MERSSTTPCPVENTATKHKLRRDRGSATSQASRFRNGKKEYLQPHFHSKHVRRTHMHVYVGNHFQKPQYFSGFGETMFGFLPSALTQHPADRESLAFSVAGFALQPTAVLLPPRAWARPQGRPHPRPPPNHRLQLPPRHSRSQGTAPSPAAPTLSRGHSHSRASPPPKPLTAPLPFRGEPLRPRPSPLAAPAPWWWPPDGQGSTRGHSGHSEGRSPGAPSTTPPTPLSCRTSPLQARGHETPGAPLFRQQGSLCFLGPPPRESLVRPCSGRTPFSGSLSPHPHLPRTHVPAASSGWDGPLARLTPLDLAQRCCCRAPPSLPDPTLALDHSVT